MPLGAGFLRWVLASRTIEKNTKVYYVVAEGLGSWKSLVAESLGSWTSVVAERLVAERLVAERLVAEHLVAERLVAERPGIKIPVWEPQNKENP